MCTTTYDFDVVEIQKSHQNKTCITVTLKLYASHFSSEDIFYDEYTRLLHDLTAYPIEVLSFDTINDREGRKVFTLFTKVVRKNQISYLCSLLKNQHDANEHKVTMDNILKQATQACSTFPLQIMDERQYDNGNTYITCALINGSDSDLLNVMLMLGAELPSIVICSYCDQSLSFYIKSDAVENLKRLLVQTA